MKIDSKIFTDINFITPDAISKQGNRVFEDYLKSALLELETSDLIKETEKEKIKFLSEKLDFSLDLLDRIAKIPLNSATSATVGDFLLAQAFEMEKVAESLPEGALKNLYKESALYIGIEAEKIRQGYYQA
ncbi:hypothetical protein THC_0693 [Caldimicrobium thiodismutans]|uniref:Uncharacterized protein n=1 Tax=Caldimicrobium thiodismutans TaxID=1653476 RepID=A0A0U4W1W8_9BACT|nr:hypothetical protein [Caldimicrobium thiodismutans]BAU23085.1 hypothetical protein THC_0693 [Caldimicrobium thiodismutans]